MKKKIIAALLLAAAAAAVIAGCGLAGGGEESVSQNDADNQQVETKVEEIDFVTYYGCPNSKRVKKLNLRKKRQNV